MTNKDGAARIHSSARTSVLLFVGSVVAWLGGAPTAGASCVAPPVDVYWTYPANGDRDVPTNAVIWVVGTLASGSVTLDGRALSAEPVSFGSARYQPDLLLPQTDHVLRIAAGEQFAADADGGVPTFEIAFRTGAGPGTNPAAPSFASFSTSSGFPTQTRCSEVIRGQDCFDTGQNTLATFAVAGDAIAWLVQSTYLGESTVWPNDCGAPSIFGHPFGDSCFELSAIGVGGLTSPSVKACPVSGAATAGSGGAGAGAAPRAGSAAGQTGAAGKGAGTGGSAIPAAAGATSPAQPTPAPSQCVAAGTLGARRAPQLSAAWALLAGIGWTRAAGRRRRATRTGGSLRRDESRLRVTL